MPTKLIGWNPLQSILHDSCLVFFGKLWHPLLNLSSKLSPIKLLTAVQDKQKVIGPIIKGFINRKLQKYKLNINENYKLGNQEQIKIIYLQFYVPSFRLDVQFFV